MKKTARLALLVTGVAMVAGQAFAQPAPQPAQQPAQQPAAGGPIDPGVYVAEVVHPLAPLHTPTIAPATVNLADIATVLDPLTPAQLLEVRQRCSTVVANAARYGEPAVNFCNAVFTWVAANRPDAPDTDAELAAMTPPPAP